MGGLSFTEILVILSLALLLFGPDELPKMARQIGKGLRELRKAGDDLRSTLETEMVKLEDETPKSDKAPHDLAAILPPKLDDPAAARAAARFAAVGAVAPPSAAVTAPEAAERKAEEITVAKPAPPEGAIPREAPPTPLEKSGEP